MSIRLEDCFPQRHSGGGDLLRAMPRPVRDLAKTLSNTDGRLAEVQSSCTTRCAVERRSSIEDEEGLLRPEASPTDVVEDVTQVPKRKRFQSKCL